MAVGAATYGRRRLEDGRYHRIPASSPARAKMPMMARRMRASRRFLSARTSRFIERAGGPDMAPIDYPKGAMPPSGSPGPSLGRAPPGSPRGREPSRLESTPWRASDSLQVLSSLVQRQQSQHGWQVEERREEHAARGRRRRLARLQRAERGEDTAGQQRAREVDRPRQSDERRQEAHREQAETSADDLALRRAADVDDGEHANPGPSVVVSVQARDGQRVGKL